MPSNISLVLSGVWRSGPSQGGMLTGVGSLASIGAPLTVSHLQMECFIRTVGHLRSYCTLYNQARETEKWAIISDNLSPPSRARLSFR